MKWKGAERPHSGLPPPGCARPDILRSMNITLSFDEEVLLLARQRAESLGTSVDKLVAGYIEELADAARRNQDADEFVRRSRQSSGDSAGWKFNRDEIHERP